MQARVIGAGLAGTEAAWQWAERGIQVDLVEMKPLRRTPAQVSDRMAELVCSNSLRSAAPRTAVGLLKDMLATYHGSHHENIVKRIARLHLTFEHAHPFVDGNGRIGRIINNYLLIREGFVPINIKFVDRQKYYDAFKEFDKKGSTKIMEEIVGKALANSYHKRLAYLEGKKIVTLSEYSKLSKISHSNLLNKAGRQSIEAFLEKGVWKIGVDVKATRKK
jgi:hypothetical protein